MPEAAREMVAGVRQYFDRCLRHFLLYSHEVQQAEEALGAGPAGAAAPKTGGAKGAAAGRCRVGRTGSLAFKCHGLAARWLVASAPWAALQVPPTEAGLHPAPAEAGAASSAAEDGSPSAGGASDQRGGAGGAAQPPRRPPSDLYGAEHLVRLFVKLPELVPVAYMTPPVSWRAGQPGARLQAPAASARWCLPCCR